jgi:hypothetical protein
VDATDTWGNRSAPSAAVSATPTATSIDAQTALLLHLNGAEGSKTFTDGASPPHAVTGTGDAHVTTSVSKFGGASCAFDGRGDHLSVSSADFQFGTGDYTVDCWARFDSITGQQVALFSIGNGYVNGADASKGIILSYYAPSNLFYIYHTGRYYTVPWTPVTNVWYHLALERQNGQLKLFVDGRQVGNTFAESGDVRPSAATWIGDVNNATYDWAFDGWIDEFRISKGVARYAQNFTPETSEYR